MLSVMLVIEELNLSVVVIESFSGWQRLVIILKCNNVNAICHNGVRERGRDRERKESHKTRGERKERREAKK